MSRYTYRRSNTSKVWLPIWLAPFAPIGYALGIALLPFYLAGYAAHRAWRAYRKEAK